MGARGDGLTSGYVGQQVKLRQLEELPTSRTYCRSMMTGATAHVDGTANREEGFSASNIFEIGQSEALGASVLFPPTYQFQPYPQLQGAAVSEWGAICAQGATDGFDGRLLSAVQAALGNTPVTECRVGASTCTQLNRGSMGGNLTMIDRTNSFLLAFGYTKADLNCVYGPECMSVTMTVINRTSAPLYCYGSFRNPRGILELAQMSATNVFGFAEIAAGASRSLNYKGPSDQAGGVSISLTSRNLVNFEATVQCSRCAMISAAPACMFAATERAGGAVGTATNSVGSQNAPDTTPDAFSFPSIDGVGLSTTLVSTQVTPTGFNAPATITVAAGQYGIGCTNFTAAAGTLNPGQSICLRHTSAAAPGQKTTTTVTVGGVQASFASTTMSNTTPASTGTVVEYVNYANFPEAPGGHFFYSANPAEQQGLDSGSGGAWFRTGRAFKAGGTRAVCRFYGSVSPGPNSHFFTADQAECDQLRSMQRSPPPASTKQWNYEGPGFMVSPTTASKSCAAGTIPVLRAYNNGFARGIDSNHRLTSIQSDIAELVSRYGWLAEGTTFCVPL